MSVFREKSEGNVRPLLINEHCFAKKEFTLFFKVKKKTKYMEILLPFKSLEHAAFTVRGWIKYFSGLEIFLQYLVREKLIKCSNLACKASILLNKVFA